MCRGLSVKTGAGGLSELSKVTFSFDFVVVNSGFKFKQNQTRNSIDRKTAGRIVLVPFKLSDQRHEKVGRHDLPKLVD